MNRFLCLCCATVVGALLLSARPASAQEFKTTPAKILAESPQRFWARGVIFRDTLTEQVDTKHKIKIGDRTAYRFRTETIGDTYADEKIVEAIEKLSPGKEYIFTASVHSSQSGLFRKKTHYRVVVNGLAIPVQELGPLADEVEAALARRSAQHPLLQQLDLLKEMIDRVQEGITALAATEQTNRLSYFEPESDGYNKLLQTARRALTDLGNESKIPDRELLVQILAALVALKEGALTQPEPLAATTNAAEEATALPEEPALETPAEETKAPRRHFWQRKSNSSSAEEPAAPAALEEQNTDAPEASAEEATAPKKTRKPKAPKVKKEEAAEATPEAIETPIDEPIPEPTAIEPTLGGESETPAPALEPEPEPPQKTDAPEAEPADDTQPEPEPEAEPAAP